MAKSHIKLPDGTDIVIDGKPEEIAKILLLYSMHGKEIKESPTKSSITPPPSQSQPEDNSDNILVLVNAIKEHKEADAIEKKILDRSSAVDRILLPLYISHESFDGKIALSTGEISKILAELGTRISGANVAHAVVGSAKSYVMGNKIRKRGGRGEPIRYKITRKGISYLSAVIKGGKD